MVNPVTYLRSAFKSILKRSGVITDYIKQARSSYRIETDSGVTVTEDTAMRLAAVFSSIGTIAATKASLPREIIEVKTGKVVHSHPVAERLLYEPNPWHTQFSWDETRMGHLLGWGNTYCEITWGRDVRPTQLTPLHPSTVTPMLDSNGQLVYRVDDHNGSRTLDRSQVLHTQGFGPNGIVGWSPLRVLANAVGIGLVADGTAAKALKNRGMPGLTVEVAGNLDDKEFNDLTEMLKQSVSGENIFMPLILEGGMKAKEFSIPLDEVMLITAREYQGKEICCRGYRLPARYAGYAMAGTTEEGDDRQMVKYCLGPWVIRDEQELQRKLFKRSELGQFRIRHNFNELLRGDIEKRFNAYKTGILCGVLTQNECRIDDDRQPIEGFDKLLLPQAIFGKPTNGTSNSDGDIWQAGAQPDAEQQKRFKVLLSRTLSGLAERELRQLDKLLSKNDPQAVADFYAGHLQHVEARLDGIADVEAVNAVRAMLIEHRDTLQKVSSHEARAAAERWPGEFVGLAELIIG